jgi:hypothetical protein
VLANKPGSNEQASQMTKSRRIFIGIAALALIYGVLLIPAPHPEVPKSAHAGMTNFIWKQDAFWESLEKAFVSARRLPASELTREAGILFTNVETLVRQVEQQALGPQAPIFRQLEDSIFRLAAFVGAAPEMTDRFAGLVFRVRAAVKEQSWRNGWDMNSFAARSCVYRLLFGGRTAVDEVIAQQTQSMSRLETTNVASKSRSAALRLLDGTLIDVRSGDLLLSRGDAPSSAFIARGNDFPGNFSHVALAHVDAATGELLIVESLIHHGLVVTRPDAYASNKLRLAVLRLRPDHPKLGANPHLAHCAASNLLERARTQRVPYDFAMDWRDSRKLFCSEVAASAYATQNVNLWMGMSHISSPGLKGWLAGFGVRHFQTQEPSDLEYDPQLQVAVEWRGDLQRDRAHNAAIDAMLEGAEYGGRLDFPLWKLPLARGAKAISACANLFHLHGKIPEGMDASAALRQVALTERHNVLENHVRKHASLFRTEHGYTPPYWALVRMALDGDTAAAGREQANRTVR